MLEADFLAQQFDLEKQEVDDAEYLVVYSGKGKGYYTVVEIGKKNCSEYQYLIKMGISLDETLGLSPAFISFIDELEQQFKPEDIEHRLSVFAVSGEPPLDRGERENLFIALLSFMVEKIEDFGLQTGDFFNNHNDRPIELYSLGGSYFLLSGQSYLEAIGRHKEEFPSDTSIKSGLKGAAIGAIIGSIIGGGIMAILYANLFIIYTGWITGLISAFFAYRFYRKNKGSITLIGILSVLGSIAFTLFITFVLLYAFDFATMGFSFSLVVIELLFTSNHSYIYPELFQNLLLGVIAAGIYGFLFYRNTKAYIKALGYIEKA